MRKSIAFYLILLTLTSIIIFFISETALRFLGHYDIDGNFYIGSRNIKPYFLPVKTAKEKLDKYLSSHSSHLIYDSVLGWAPRPNSKFKNGHYSYNSYGIRSAPFEYSLSPEKNTLRIAIFGDSFTHGANVSFRNTWGYYLENNLKQAGINAEVLNFGVSGYGIDQAYLRWKYLGHKFSPHIVILGFQAENVKRNVNLIKLIYAIGGLPFSKPRFIIENNSLKLINVPTIFPKKILDVIQNIEKWDLVKYEHFYKPEDYHSHIWHRSKLIPSILSFIQINRFNRFKIENSFFSLNKEPALLTLKIIEAFKATVEANGSKFLVVHLPRNHDLSILLDNQKLVYESLLMKIGQNNEVIHPEYEMLKEAKSSSLDSLFVGHYSAKGNKIVADVIAKFIINDN